MRVGAGIDFIEGFLPEEIAEWRPPERLTVAGWADKYRVLDAAVSPEPGPWRTDRVPYARAWMDAFNDPEVEVVVIQSATQVAKTETLLNILGYIIDQRPGPTMVVYPTLESAEDISRTRIQPMINAHKRLKRKKFKDRHLFTTLRMQFMGMDLFLSGANSAASLASKPCEYLLLDEVNKYPAVIREEADPVSLALERTKNFPYSRKVLMVSTPTTQFGRITQELEDCDVVFDYVVPCPHCGRHQPLKFSQVKWPDIDKDDPERLKIIEETAAYQCEHCKRMILDHHKREMLNGGRWQPDRDGTRRKKIGFRLSSLYSPWVRFGEMAVAFLKAKDFPEKLQNFVNSWLGEPWAERTVSLKSDSIFALCDDRPRGVVPVDAPLLIGAADVQLNGFYFGIRAFGQGKRSGLVREGFVESFSDLDQVFFDSTYPVAGDESERRAVRLVLIDSGYRTDEVYDWVRRHPNTRAVKGATHPMKAPFQPSRIDYNLKGRLIRGGLTIWLIDTRYWKDALLRRMQSNLENPGMWTVHKDITRDYADQMVAEQKVIVRDRKSGRETIEWRKVSNHAANHYWDVEVYLLAGSEMAGVRWIDSLPERGRPPERASAPPKPKVARSKWMSRTANYY